MRFLIPLLLSASVQAATLKWDPSPTNAIPVSSYRIYSTPVGQTNWSQFGNTTNLSLFVTGNVWRAFHVRAVSPAGVESDPSNIATNFFADHQPTNVLVTAYLERAQAPGGPWLIATSMVMQADISSNQYFRARLNITTP